MARARNIKPSFFKNEDLAELPFSTRLLFIGLWTLADREGLLEDRPKRIKMEIFPGDDVNVEKGLNELHTAGFIHRYVVDDRGYIEVCAFVKHQNPHHREPPSTIPKPEASPRLDGLGTKQKPEALPKSEPPSARGQPEASPKKARPSPADSGFLIPDSGFLKPEEKRAATASDDLTAGPPPKVDAREIAPAVRLSILLNRLGVKTQPMHPTLQQWASEGVTEANIEAAFAIAREHKPEPKTVPLAYLVPIVEQVRNPIDRNTGKPRETLTELLAREEAEANAQH